jgi:hypothetical protein
MCISNKSYKGLDRVTSRDTWGPDWLAESPSPAIAITKPEAKSDEVTLPPCPPFPADDLPFAEPSAEWIAANEANWCNATDADVDYLTGPRQQPEPCTWCGGRLHHSEACEALQQSWIPAFPFGRHKGKRVDEVPWDYLRWAWDNGAIRDVDVKEAVRKLLGIREPLEREAAALEPPA